jgi:hypothetical protein
MRIDKGVILFLMAAIAIGVFLYYKFKGTSVLKANIPAANGDVLHIEKKPGTISNVLIDELGRRYEWRNSGIPGYQDYKYYLDALY